MSEVTYLPQVQCKVSEGLTWEDITVSVRDIDGWDQYIHVLPSLVNRENERTYLPVGIINVDRRNERVLVELPTEADSGVNRMWISFDSFRTESGITAWESAGNYFPIGKTPSGCLGSSRPLAGEAPRRRPRLTHWGLARRLRPQAPWCLASGVREVILCLFLDTRRVQHPGQMTANM
jgi:hypothetical protein